MAFFPSLKQNFIAHRSSKASSRPDCIFEIHQQWQSDFSRVYSNCCCSCSFKPGLSSYKMYSTNILNFQESSTLKCLYKKVCKVIECTNKIYSWQAFFLRVLYFLHRFILDGICLTNFHFQLYTVIWKKVNIQRKVLLFYNFKQSSCVHHLCQHILEISHR